MKQSSNVTYKLFLVVLLLCAYSPIFSQTDSILLQINEEHLQFKKNGMQVLGGWALTNIAVSGFMLTQTRGVNYRFHEMNVFWNIVNLGIAGLGYYDAQNTSAEGIGLIETLSNNQGFGKILLLNAGLDVGYVMSGLYLRERSKQVSKLSNRLKGYGNSIILQGGFLLVFDIVLYSINQNKISIWLEQHNFDVQISPVSVSLGMNF